MCLLCGERPVGEGLYHFRMVIIVRCSGDNEVIFLNLSINSKTEII